MLKNKTKNLFVPFVRHIELQNFLIAPRISTFSVNVSFDKTLMTQLSYFSAKIATFWAINE